MSKKAKDSIIVGFALFAVFFGAGNLIFPPAIGLAAGKEWPTAMIALILAAIILPILAIISVSNVGGSFEQLTAPVGRWFYLTFNVLCMVGVGILANVPRTAATTHETSVATLFPNVPIQITMVVYFVLVCYLSIDKSNFIDKIGKFITPLLLIILIVTIVKGIISPLGTPTEANVTGVFTYTFTELYFTGDLLTGLLCTPIFISAIRGKGYTDKKDTHDLTINAALISAVGFLIVYGGLLIIAAGCGGIFPADIGRTALLSGIMYNIGGTIGTVGLSVAVMLACLSTAVGLTVVSADFLSSLTKGKVSYKIFVIVACVIGAVVGMMGVDNIISFAGPIFFLLYPASILLTILGLLKKFIPNDNAYRYSVIFTLLISALQALQVLGVNNNIINTIVSAMPFSSAGFGWICPAIAGFIFGMIINLFAPKSKATA